MKKFSSDYCSRMFSKRKSTFALITSSSIFIIACSSALYFPSQSNVTVNASLDDLQKGRQLYINKCSSCHSLILPEKHTASEWKIWVEKMRPKAKTNEPEEKLIIKYLSRGLN